MSDYRISQEINLFEIADKYAKRLQEQVDEMTLDKAADTLERYGYVKVVRCRDCAHRYGCLHLIDYGDGDMRRCDATPDGFCAWGVRKEGGDD